MPRIGDHKQFLSGLFFFCIGLGALAMLPSNIGTATQMGPGYFPMLLGICLLLFGGTSMILGIRAAVQTRVAPVPVVTLLLILGGVVSFSLLIEWLGLAASLFCLVLLSCFKRLRAHPLEILSIYLALLGMSWFIFIHVIQLPMSLF
jgi:hypothetical protein